MQPPSLNNSDILVSLRRISDASLCTWSNLVKVVHQYGHQAMASECDVAQRKQVRIDTERERNRRKVPAITIPTFGLLGLVHFGTLDSIRASICLCGSALLGHRLLYVVLLAGAPSVLGAACRLLSGGRRLRCHWRRVFAQNRAW